MMNRVTFPIDGMRFVVGCPVRNRKWILSDWFEHVYVACQRAGTGTPLFAFVLGNSEDATNEYLEGLIKDRRIAGIVSSIDDEEPAKIDRDWGPDRYHHMVKVRNNLLDLVREGWGADVFLSLDSDILLHPDALRNMLWSLERFDAVGGKTYMTRQGTICPSYAMLTRNGALRRPDSAGIFQVDVIMAIKMMASEALYRVDYEWSSQGEDIGWSKAARRAGVSLGWDGRVASKHVMDRAMLDVVDERVGF